MHLFNGGHLKWRHFRFDFQSLTIDLLDTQITCSMLAVNCVVNRWAIFSTHLLSDSINFNFVDNVGIWQFCWQSWLLLFQTRIPKIWLCNAQQHDQMKWIWKHFFFCFVNDVIFFFLHCRINQTQTDLIWVLIDSNNKITKRYTYLSHLRHRFLCDGWNNAFI